MDKSAFVKQVYDAARSIGLSDVAARVAASQAALETNFGARAPGNNYFGIKGKGQVLSTKEGGNGTLSSTKQSFRTYDSMSESVADWARQMQRNWPQVLTATNYDDAINALNNGRLGAYATDGVEKNDPLTYQDKLSNIATKYLPAQGYTSDFSTMAAANQQAASIPPLPIPRPASPNGAPVIGSNTGQTFRVGDLINSPDGVHKLLVQDDGTGHAKFVRQLNPGEVPGVFDPYKAVGADKTPSLLGDFINSRPDIAGPLQMAKGLGLTANQAAQLAANPPTISAAPVQQAVQNAASATQSTVGNAVKQGTSALGDFGNSAVNMLGGLFNSAPKAPTPPASIPSVPTNTGWATAWGAAPTPVQQTPAAAQNYAPTMPTGGPGTFPAAGLPAAPYMPTMPTGGPGTYGPAGMPAAPILPMAPPAPLTPQIGTPPGTQLRMTVNRAPSPPPVQMTQIATGKRVPVGTVTPHGGVVQANGSINHGSWSTPGPGQDLKWWQANSMGYTV